MKPQKSKVAPVHHDKAEPSRCWWPYVTVTSMPSMGSATSWRETAMSPSWRRQPLISNGSAVGKKVTKSAVWKSVPFLVDQQGYPRTPGQEVPTHLCCRGELPSLSRRHCLEHSWHLQTLEPPGPGLCPQSDQAGFEVAGDLEVETKDQLVLVCVASASS